MPTKAVQADDVAATADVVLVRTPHATGRMPALRHGDDLLLPAAALAHLAVEARGCRRVRRGPSGWQQAGSDGEWSDLVAERIGEVRWYRVDAGWRLQQVGQDAVVEATVPVVISQDILPGIAAGQERLPTQRGASRPSLTVVNSTRRPA